MWIISNSGNGSTIDHVTIGVGNSTVVIVGNVTVGDNVTLVFESGGLVQISDCLYMNGSKILLKLGGDDTYVPVNGTLVELLSYKNCSVVHVSNVTVEQQFACKHVTGTPVQTDNKFSVLLNVADTNNEAGCHNSHNNNSWKTITIAVVCTCVGLSAIGVGVAWWWRKRQQKQEEQDMEMHVQ